MAVVTPHLWEIKQQRVAPGSPGWPGTAWGAVPRRSGWWSRSAPDLEVCQSAVGRHHTHRKATQRGRHRQDAGGRPLPRRDRPNRAHATRRRHSAGTRASAGPPVPVHCPVRSRQIGSAESGPLPSTRSQRAGFDSAERNKQTGLADTLVMKWYCIQQGVRH